MRSYLICISMLFSLTIGFSTSAFAVQTWMGQQKALVLLVEWADTPAQHSQAEMNDAFFKDNDFSLKQFFLENSVGKFEITGAVTSWKKSNYNWLDIDGCNPAAIAKIAWDMYKNDVKISDYDSDNNGKIDNLFIVHSGKIPHDRVGPDCMFTRLASAEETAVFQTEGVGSIGKSIPIGFYVHEAGHQLFSFPDLYADHYHGNYGIGMWGMMGLGCWGVNNEIAEDVVFSRPSHFEPLSKIAIGWVTPIVITKSQKKVRIAPVEFTGQIIKIVNSGEDFYLEYRSPNGFSAGHKGHGLLIWREYDLIQADGRDDLRNGNNLGERPLPPNSENFGDSSDPFPGSLNVTSYEPKDKAIRISNIKHNEEWIEFDVEINKKAIIKAPKKSSPKKFDRVERL